MTPTKSRTISAQPQPSVQPLARLSGASSEPINAGVKDGDKTPYAPRNVIARPRVVILSVLSEIAGRFLTRDYSLMND